MAEINALSQEIMLIEMAEYLSLIEDKPPAEVNPSLEFIEEYYDKLITELRPFEKGVIKSVNSPI